jgi:metal-dependent amidase/aminoacylase/carboxypeptidase family protein
VLQEHAVGKREMTPSQVQAANILLRKVVPDKAEVEATIRKVESLTDEQSRLAAEEMIESARHRNQLRQAQPDRVHDAVSPGLSSGEPAPQNSSGT